MAKRPQQVIVPRMDIEALVVRHNDLIESKHSMTLVERRFMLWIVSQINSDDEHLKKYTISVTDWAQFMGLQEHSKIYRDIYNMAEKLMEKTVSIRQENGSFKIFSWFHRIECNAGEGTLTAIMHEDMRPYLLQLKNHYTSLTLKHALILNSSYAGRIYDILKQYEKVGVRTLSFQELRDMLKTEKKYKQQRDFIKRVITPSQKEINAKTDISFDYEMIKQGRAFKFIRFHIRKESPHVTLESRQENEPKADKIYRHLCNYGVAEKTATALTDKYDDERLTWHINAYEDRKTKGKTDGVGWLIKAIQEDYRQQKPLIDLQKEDARNKKAKAWEQQKQQKEIEEKAKSLIVAFENALADHARIERSKLPPAKQQEVDTEFLAFWEAHPDPYFDYIKEFNLNGLTKSVALEYAKTLEKYYPEKGYSIEDYALEKGIDSTILASAIFDPEKQP